MIIQSSSLDQEGRSEDWENHNREKEPRGNSKDGSGCRADLVFYPLWIRLSCWSHVSIEFPHICFHHSKISSYRNLKTARNFIPVLILLL